LNTLAVLVGATVARMFDPLVLIGGVVVFLLWPRSRPLAVLLSLLLSAALFGVVVELSGTRAGGTFTHLVSFAVAIWLWVGIIAWAKITWRAIARS
jgi:hypothetical protein